jgi:hypothetical protein
MAVRRPIYLTDPFGGTGIYEIYEFTDPYMTDIVEFAGYAHAQNPGVQMEVGGTNGTQLANQNFTDTYYVAGSYTTRVDRYSTEAETPNISMVTDTYSLLREVRYSGSLDMSDTNNLKFPLYITDDGNLRAMTAEDFIDTFVLPALPSFGGGGVSLAKGGTYFLTTSTSPANATLVSATPAAVNSVANVAAYSSGGIPETSKQTIDTNYYLAKVDYDITLYDPMEAVLPVYFDAGTETIRQHTLTSWVNLISPFLQYYTANDPTYKLSYNVDGPDGAAAGTQFVDERVVPTGTGYTTRFVNANDYRTQEFPTGTATTVSGSGKQFKIHQGEITGETEVVSLEGTSGTPETNFAFTLPGTGGIQLGWEFRTDGVIASTDQALPSGGVTTRTTGHIPWNNVTPTGTWYIRITDVTSPISGQSTFGYSSGSWVDLTSFTRACYITDTRPFGSYGFAQFTWKIDISRNNDGTNIEATGYYSQQWEGGA